MEKVILYNGRNYRKHSKQNYYYVSRKQKNYSRCLHRQKWFDCYGEIPEGMEVHHIDENPFNNDITNYELKSKSIHMAEHGKRKFKDNPIFAVEFQKKGILKAVEWHKSVEGREWHKLNGSASWKNKVKYIKICVQCKKEYKTYFPNRSKYCHNNCKASNLRMRRKDSF